MKTIFNGQGDSHVDRDEFWVKCVEKISRLTKYLDRLEELMMPLEGELLGQIKLLGISNPSSDELSSYNVVQLSEEAEQLQNQLRSRGS